MTLEEVKSLIPDYAKDIRLNFSTVLQNHSLSQEESVGSALASALVTGNKFLIKTFRKESESILSQEKINAVHSAASIMSMTNIWYKFISYQKNEEVKKIPPKLRMNVLANSAGVEKKIFEVWSLAVSVVNACPMCINAHTKELEKHGYTSQNIVDIARIATITKSTAEVLKFSSD